MSRNRIQISVVVAIGALLPSAAHTQYYYAGPSSLVVPYYQGANAIYQMQMQQQGRPSAPIGSPQFFRYNFTPQNYNNYPYGGQFIGAPRPIMGPPASPNGYPYGGQFIGAPRSLMVPTRR